MNEETIDLVKVKNEVNQQLANPEILQDLVNTTFKNLDHQMVKRAIYEGMMRGFTFRNFLEKDIYAIPFKSGYSLVTSIDYARKIGMRSGIVGKDAPIYDEKDGKIISCTITVKKKTGSYVGDFTATVYFDEFFKKGKYSPSLWETKPHVMVAKVAEMAALRMACPEEMAQMYVEEEYTPQESIEIPNYSEKLRSAKTVDELKKAWDSLPGQMRTELSALKDEIKSSLQSHITGVVVNKPTEVPMAPEKQTEVPQKDPEVDLDEVDKNLEPFTPEERKAQEDFLTKEGVESLPF